ncbi:MAG: alpha/beta fold hydrolase [Alphaproteobacteria bacterium]
MSEPISPVRETVDLPGRGSFSLLRWPGEAAHPLLIFCHATGFNAETYKVLLTPLTSRFRVVALDLRGHGMTAAPANPKKLKSWSVYPDDLCALLKLWNEPAFLSGHSMGGAVAMIAASRLPALVRGMVPVDPVMIPAKAARAMRFRRLFGLTGTSPLAIGAARRRAVFGSRDMMFDAYQGRGAFATWPDQVLRDYIAGGSKDLPNGEVALACAPAWESATFSSAGNMLGRIIRNIDCPVSILYAEEGSTIRPEVVALITSLRPEWSLEEVPGTTHFLPMEEPEIVRQAILDMAGLA